MTVVINLIDIGYMNAVILNTSITDRVLPEGIVKSTQNSLNHQDLDLICFPLCVPRKQSELKKKKGVGYVWPNCVI